MVGSISARMARSLAAVAVLGVFVSVLAVGRASAAAPWWELTSGSRPAKLIPESEGEVVATAENLGDATIHGETTPARIVDTLPAGLKAVGIAAGSCGSALPLDYLADSCGT